MYAIKGYFNGKKLIPLERADLKPNQKVIITILDEYMDKDDQETNNKKIAAIEAVNGLLKDEEAEKVTDNNRHFEKINGLKVENWVDNVT